MVVILGTLLPLFIQAHSVSEWLTIENLARLKQEQFLNDEEKEAWRKLSQNSGVLRKVLENTHPEYLSSESLREGLLRDILGPLEKETVSASDVDVSSDLTLSLEDLPGMGRFLASHEATEAEIKELRESLADKVALSNAIFDDITETATETVKQTDTDCPK